MYEQPRYYELHAYERLRELQREMAHERLLAQVAPSPRVWRRGVQLLGRVLVTIGTRLQKVEPSEQTAISIS